MANKELFSCNCCGKKTTGYIGLTSQIEGGGTADSLWGEISYRLCPKCYYNWYKGYLSTKRLIAYCAKTLNREVRRKRRLCK